jgi:hypothetical protein
MIKTSENMRREKRRKMIPPAKKSGWIYGETAAKRYGLARYQLWCAAADGLVDADLSEYGELVEADRIKFVSDYTLLLKKKDVEARIEQIRNYPKEGQDDACFRKVIAAVELEFFCPGCRKVKKPKMDSETLDAYIRGEIRKDEASRSILVSRYRHDHTAYNVELAKIYKRYREKLRVGRHEDVEELKRQIAELDDPIYRLLSGKRITRGREKFLLQAEEELMRMESEIRELHRKCTQRARELLCKDLGRV